MKIVIVSGCLKVCNVSATITSAWLAFIDLASMTGILHHRHPCRISEGAIMAAYPRTNTRYLTLVPYFEYFIIVQCVLS